MNYEILEALGQITKDKNIDMDFVIESLEAGLMLAAKKKFGNTDNIKIEVDRKSGEIKIVAVRKVVEQVTPTGARRTSAPLVTCPSRSVAARRSLWIRRPGSTTARRSPLGCSPPFYAPIRLTPKCWR